VINEYIKYTIDDMLHIYVLLFNIIKWLYKTYIDISLSWVFL
jgi:hypothetical protein